MRIAMIYNEGIIFNTDDHEPDKFDGHRTDADAMYQHNGFHLSISRANGLMDILNGVRVDLLDHYPVIPGKFLAFHINSNGELHVYGRMQRDKPSGLTGVMWTRVLVGPKTRFGILNCGSEEVLDALNYLLDRFNDVDKALDVLCNVVKLKRKSFEYIKIADIAERLNTAGYTEEADPVSWIVPNEIQLGGANDAKA